jgi:Kef-type K+ transport system membrane component KefB
MKIVAGIVLVLIIALLGSRFSFARLKLPFLRGSIFLTGTEYLLVGMALGPLLLGLFDAKTQQGLHPMINLALGWIGLLFGAQLELRQLKRFPRQYLRFALLQALITLGVCLAALGALYHHLPRLLAPLSLSGLLTLAAIAVPTAQTSLALVLQELPTVRNKLLEILRFTAGVDGVVALLTLGVVSCLELLRSPVGLEQLVPLQYLALALALGGTGGLLLHLLTRVRCAQEELLLFTVGLVVFTAGAAAYLRLPPLFVTLIAGLVLANLRGQQDRVMLVLVQLEKPFYLVVLLVAGARFVPLTPLTSALALAGGYVVLRALGKSLAGLFIGRLLRRPLRLPPKVGLGLLPQGGVAVAMAVSAHQASSGAAADAVLFIVLTAVVASELVGPALTRWVVRADGSAQEHSREVTG